MALACNVGGDKIFRIVFGLALIVVAVFVDMATVWKAAAGVAAAIALITAFVGFCPLNRSIGINACRPRTTT